VELARDAVGELVEELVEELAAHATQAVGASVASASNSRSQTQ
jgi:hypothetical protein